MEVEDDRLWRAGLGLLAVTTAVAVWLLATRVFPYHSLNHDEAVYLQQAAMLLDGQVFLKPPVEGAFRPWFFVEDGSRLYAKYTPVPAAVFALGMVVGLPRLSLVAVGAAIVGLVALVVGEVFDRPTGLLAGVFVLCSPLFLIDTSMFLPYAPTTAFNLTFLYAYLRADRAEGDTQLRWAAGAGLAVALAFFARQYTTVLFALPVIVHALWTLRENSREALPRQAVTAAVGLVGVLVTFGYNALVTGDPFLFPYLAFAPQDGLGFGYHKILGHDVTYTVELALRSNALVLEALASRWVAGGLLGTAMAIAGLGVAVRRGLSARAAILVGQVVAIVAGNVYFWGNYNILGQLDRANDGLIVSHGPYYHFDLLLPFAAFAAVGLLALCRTVRSAADRRTTQRGGRVALAAVLLVSVVALGVPTAGAVDDTVQQNMIATETYDRVYDPVEQASFDDGLVFLPTPYGDWLNHPFQALRNDPGFDGEVVYAMDERPFAVVDAYPNRTLHRFAFRGDWAPYRGSPRAARLQQVEHVAGEAVALNATIGLPEAYYSVTTTVTTDEDSRTYVATDVPNPVSVRLRIEDDSARVVGPAWDGPDAVPLDDGDDDVEMTVFVDRGPGASYSYQFEVPIEHENGTVRALTPRVEWCVSIGECGGAAAYVPNLAPSETFVRTELREEDR